MQVRHASPDGSLAVTSYGGAEVFIVSTGTNKVIDTIKTGKQPASIDFLPDGRHGYVTDEGSGAVEILNFPQ